MTFELPWHGVVEVLSTKIGRFRKHDQLIAFLVRIFKLAADVRINADIQDYPGLDRSLSLKYKGKKWDIVVKTHDHTYYYIEIKTRRKRYGRQRHDKRMNKEKRTE